jgi:inosine-uridine nucleoside N-ribohydrolase
MDRPLIEAPRPAPRIHGESGLDGPVFAPARASPRALTPSIS